jgi:uncharacterized damage-inducible protein DinB
MDLKTLIVTRLSDHLDELQSFLKGLPDAQLQERPASDRWSIGENALHIIDMQDTYLQWVARMIVEEMPVLENGSVEQVTERRHPMEELPRRLKEFSEQRKTLLSLLNALTDQQWVREGVHPQIKHYTVEKCMEGLMRHEEYHFYEMYNMFFGIDT